jgi:hypothetical protein
LTSPKQRREATPPTCRVVPHKNITTERISISIT